MGVPSCVSSISIVGVIVSVPSSAKSSSSSAVARVTEDCKKFPNTTPEASRVNAVVMFCSPSPRTNEIVYLPILFPESTLMLPAPIPVTALRASVKLAAVAPIGIPVVLVPS